MDAKAQRMIDDLESLVDYDPQKDLVTAQYTVYAESALKMIKAACALIADQSERIEKQNREIIKLESKLASAGEDDQDDDFENVKTIIQCNEKIRKLTDRVQYMSGQISVYDRLFASVFDSDSPQADI